MPQGWRLKTWAKGTVLLTHRMKQFTLKAVLQMMENSGRYPEKIIQDLKEFEHKEIEESKTSIDKDLAVMKPHFNSNDMPQVETVGENDPEKEPKMSEEDGGPADTADTTLHQSWKMLSYNSGGCPQLQSPKCTSHSSKENIKITKGFSFSQQVILVL